MKKTLTTENIRMGQLLVLKKTSVGYNTFGNDVYMYLEPCIEDWGYHCEGPETFGFSRGDLVMAQYLTYLKKICQDLIKHQNNFFL